MQERRREILMKTERQAFVLCDQIRETSFALHRYLRHGHLEKVYEMDWHIVCERRAYRWNCNIR